jgi:putative ABC transport system permease protein
MNFWAVFKVAARALARNKMRSALTTLGIIIGVSAVIALVSIGQGAQHMVQNQISSFGSNLLFVMPGNVVQNGANITTAGGNSLTIEDVIAIERELHGIAGASPVLNASRQGVYGNQNWNLRIQGTNEKFTRIRTWPTSRGAFFTDADVQSAARVIVLGNTVAEKLFPGEDPVGKAMRVGNLQFTVVGVLAEKGSGFTGDQDDIAVVPYTTVQKKLMQQRSIFSIGQAMVSARSERGAALAETQIAELLRQRHRIPEGEADDFRIQNMSDVAAASGQVLRIMTLLLAGIAGISLMVGGIGIMNIMLVSVTERTREIGIRMAVGARPSYIRLQFLTESVVLSLAGGIMGMLIGGSAAAAFAWYFEWPTLVSKLAVTLAFTFSTAIGVFFGYYPAHKAAALDPIEALRYE